MRLQKPSRESRHRGRKSKDGVGLSKAEEKRAREMQRRHWEKMSPAERERVVGLLKNPFTLGGFLRYVNEQAVPEYARVLLPILPQLQEAARSQPEESSLLPFSAVELGAWAWASRVEKIRGALDTPKARLRWLYDLAYAEPSRYVGVELDLFLYPVIEASMDAKSPFVSVAAARPVKDVVIDDDLVGKFRLSVKDMWERLRAGERTVRFAAPVIDGLEAVESEGNVRVRATGGPTVTDLFWASVVKLFDDVGSFRFCKRAACAKPYVPPRAWSVFCGPSCSSRERQARYRTTHADKVSEDRHERYADEVKKKLPNAKPARRPRGKSPKRGTT